MTGEVPRAILDAVRRDLSRRALVTPEQLQVIEASERTWNDGSLGCAAPGQIYTQALTPGYRIVLSAAGRRYDYHASRQGRFVLCEAGTPYPPLAAEPTATR